MRKIPTLFRRDNEQHSRVTDELDPACAWVLDGEGVATRKWDGMCVKIQDGAMFARREVRPGKRTPPDFEQVAFDAATRRAIGWVPVTTEHEFARHREALATTKRINDSDLEDGTYELIGPKVNGNAEQFSTHILLRHGRARLTGVPLSFEGLRDYLKSGFIEGIVWWREPGNLDADMAKLKRRDFR